MTSAVHIIILVFTVLTAILLIGIVLIQKSKGGGLSSQFGGAGNMMGVRQTNSFLEKATWTLAALILVFSVASAFTMPKVSTTTEIRTEIPANASAPAGNQFDTQATTGTEQAQTTEAIPVEENNAETTPVVPATEE